MSCAEPISWLRLERHRLGEDDAAERAAIAAHLATCAACAAMLARIAEDDAQPLRPLRRRRSPLGIAGGASALLAAAAAVLFGAFRTPPGDVRIKGDAVAFSLVGDDEALLVEAGGTYRDGERFKALVTCPPGKHAAFDLVVFENGTASFPIRAADLACENAAPLAGAFRLTGEARLVVCLVWDSVPIDREAVRRATSADLVQGAGMNALCKTLDPAR